MFPLPSFLIISAVWRSDSGGVTLRGSEVARRSIRGAGATQWTGRASAVAINCGQPPSPLPFSACGGIRAVLRDKLLSPARVLINEHACELHSATHVTTAYAYEDAATRAAALRAPAVGL